ncbi:MAG: DUF2807 domain-containing protein [Flavobacteriales bacterium]|nr:DUF2807 domain-containing protein [Flavobacteriales bacterium]
MQRQAFHFVSSLLLAASLLTSSCQKEGAGCAQGRGEQSEEIRTLSTFTHLYVEGRVNVRLFADSVDYVRVAYGQNGLAGIQTIVSNDTLSIGEVNQCDWLKKIDPLPLVEIHYSSLNSIFSQSAAEVRFMDAFVGDSLRVEIEDAAGSLHVTADCERLNLFVHTGATDVTLKGSSMQLYIYNSGYGPIHAEEFVARTAIVHNNGTADTYVRAWENVFTQIYHLGNIYVSGDPALTRWHEEGGGQVFFVD